MEVNPPPPPSNPPAPQVVVVKKRGCLGWIGIGVVALFGLMVVAVGLAAVVGSGDSSDEAQVQSVISDDQEGVVGALEDSGSEQTETDTPAAAEPSVGPDGSRDKPWPAGSTVDVTWDVFGDADGSVWTTTIGEVTDITAEVLAENEFNDEPPDGAIFAAFPVEMTLVSANKEPLSAGFNLSFEIHGVANVYDVLTLDTIGCGVTPNDFDAFSEVFAGGTVEGVVCIPIPADELANATAVVKFGNDRIWFD